LLKADVPFALTDVEERSFQQLKKALCKPLISVLPDLSKEMILTTDASDTSISYNLSMIKDGKNVLYRMEVEE